jgi:predicted HicB family RNase H-like nuclease
MFQYKGYIGDIIYDADERVFVGKVLNADEPITFRVTEENRIQQTFQKSIDDFLDWCRREGIQPKKPYSGRLFLRISPELHQRIATVALKLNQSLNQFVEGAIEEKVKSSLNYFD